MDYKIAIIKGDGVGPEIVDEAIKVINKIGTKFSHRFELNEVLAGGAAIDAYGDPLPKETLNVCKKSDSILLGAVGGSKWDCCKLELRPEKALLKLRAELSLFSNLRPATLFTSLEDACVLRKDIRDKGIDIMVVRELTGGIYFGKRELIKTDVGDIALDTEQYSEKEVRRIAKVAFDIARKRRKVVTSVDKANVLESSRLWRKIVTEVSSQYDDVTLNHMYVDNAAMQLIKDPSQFDVLLTTNMFGDILSDEASQITGSIGMLPSASLGDSKLGMYEPIHGSAPDIAGKNIANPIATILSVAMMFRYSFDLQEEANAIESSVKKVLDQGYRTEDIYTEGTKKLTTTEMGTMITENI